MINIKHDYIVIKCLLGTRILATYSARSCYNDGLLQCCCMLAAHLAVATVSAAVSSIVTCNGKRCLDIFYRLLSGLDVWCIRVQL